ncbi:MAG: 23S rRNA (adenine(2030)-N(6))-methyltransferase RlmJ [Congregibacter sp.]|nr:23S rRNA (adenine(2030)-N(6))-methyltransferase RlmJ [Congregibacter sp.]
MLSYQHEYHAGNFADVHKHVCLRVLFEALLKKDKPFCYIDCHAGAGIYALDSAQARKTAEADAGIHRLWTDRAQRRSPTMTAYLKTVAAFNTNEQLSVYPGSPALASHWLREQDRALMLELHPQAQRALKENFRNDPRISIHGRDCYEGLPSLLPPVIKRGLVLLDPSYEVKSEYRKVVALCVAAKRRWPNGVFALWYPLLPADYHLGLLHELRESGFESILLSEMTVVPKGVADGMYGSGLAIVNPPWQMDEQLDDLVNGLASVLSPAHGKARVHWLARAC